MLYDHLSLQEKYSILISYLLKKFQDFSRTFSFFLFQDFPKPGNLFDHSPGFKGFPGCVETLGGRPLQFQEGTESLCFHGLIFFSVYSSLQSQRKSQNLVRYFRGWP